MGYPNLEAELARNGITRGQIADLLKKDKSTISTWMNGGRAGFSVKDAMAVRREFFPNMTLDYLFSEEPITVATASVR